MKDYRLLILISVLCWCVSCQSKEQLQAQQMRAARNAEIQGHFANSKICNDNALQTEEAHRLKENFYISVDDSRTFDKLNNNSHITDRNKSDFVSFRNNIQSCRDQLLMGYSLVDKRYESVISNSYLQRDNILLKLLNKEITIGEYNKAFISIVDESKKQMSDVDRAKGDEFMATVQMMQNIIANNQRNNYQQQMLNLQQ